MAALVLFLLKRSLDRELFLCALEKLAHVSVDEAAGVDEVVVVAARKLSGDEGSRLRTVIKERWPQAEVIVGEDRALGGGIVIRAAGHVLDLSLGTRIKQLFKRSDA